MTTTIDTLISAGMEPVTAEIYLILIQSGELTVPKILEKTPLSRASVYDALTVLVAQEYVEYRKQGRNAFYKPGHPNKLLELIEQKKRDVALLEGEVRETVSSLIGTYNLTQHRPGVRFYEGKAGVIQAYEDLLALGQNIDSIEDKGEMMEFIGPYVLQFIKKRIEKNIFNRVISPSNNPINISSEKEKREARSIPLDQFPFSMDIKMCANTVLLVTLREQSAIAIRIEDPLITNNFRLIFNFFWLHAATARSSSGDSTSSAARTDSNT